MEQWSSIAGNGGGSDIFSKVNIHEGCIQKLDAARKIFAQCHGTDLAKQTLMCETVREVRHTKWRWDTMCWNEASNSKINKKPFAISALIIPVIVFHLFSVSVYSSHLLSNSTAPISLNHHRWYSFYSWNNHQRWYSCSGSWSAPPFTVKKECKSWHLKTLVTVNKSLCV